MDVTVYGQASTNPFLDAFSLNSQALKSQVLRPDASSYADQRKCLGHITSKKSSVFDP